MASENAETMDQVFRGTEEELERTNSLVLIIHHAKASFFVAFVKRWLHDGKGPMASKSVSVVFHLPAAFADSLQNSGIDSGIKLRPTNEELLSMSPEFNHRWSTYFANAPDKPVVIIFPFAW